MTLESSVERSFLRHVLATIAYRGGKVLRDSPVGFAEFEVSPGSRTPLEILAHIGDVLDWAVGIVDGDHGWKESSSRSWSGETERFFRAIGQLDRVLESGTNEQLPTHRLFQGPLADTLTHIGQLAMLRRIAGSPVKGENYFKAHVVAGSVGPEQNKPESEFD